MLSFPISSGTFKRSFLAVMDNWVGSDQDAWKRWSPAARRSTAPSIGLPT
jgi:hypothetical protein